MNNSYSPPEGIEFYDQILADYDRMIDWESRLDQESPFLEQVVAENHVKSILDVACGTGRHCFHFETLGVETIVGVDPSSKLLGVAKARAAATSSETKFIEASFTNVTDKIQGPFDMVSTLGNSISHLLTLDDLNSCLKNFHKLCSPGGIILIQLLNWGARLAKNERFFKPRAHPTPKGEKLFFRFFDFQEELVTMNLVIFESSESKAGSWSYRIISTTLYPWRKEVISRVVKDSGFVIEQEFGGTNLSAYNPVDSHDYILIARSA